MGGNEISVYLSGRTKCEVFLCREIAVDLPFDDDDLGEYLTYDSPSSADPDLMIPDQNIPFDLAFDQCPFIRDEIPFDGE